MLIVDGSWFDFRKIWFRFFDFRHRSRRVSSSFVVLPYHQSCTSLHHSSCEMLPTSNAVECAKMDDVDVATSSSSSTINRAKVILHCTSTHLHKEYDCWMMFEQCTCVMIYICLFHVHRRAHRRQCDTIMESSCEVVSLIVERRTTKYIDHMRIQTITNDMWSICAIMVVRVIVVDDFPSSLPSVSEYQYDAKWIINYQRYCIVDIITKCQ